MKNEWKVVSSKIVHQNPWYHIREDKVVDPDGYDKVYYILETLGPSVFIVALTDQEEIYLIKQFRYQTNKWSWEIPGGNAGKEDPKVAAARELQEETGLIAKDIEEFGVNQVMNGVSNEVCYMFLARNLTQTGKNEQEEEGITRLDKFPVPKVLEMIKNGELTDSQSIGGVVQALLYLGHKLDRHES